MKKSVLSSIFMALLSLAASSARADQVALNYINTNDCEKARSEVMLLNGPNAAISASCAGPGAFQSSNGQVYQYRLTTVVSIPGPVQPGVVVQLNDIDTNNCTWAQSEIRLLSSRAVTIQAECSPFGQYPSNNGMVYNYRLYTTMVVN